MLEVVLSSLDRQLLNSSTEAAVPGASIAYQSTCPAGYAPTHATPQEWNAALKVLQASIAVYTGIIVQVHEGSVHIVPTSMSKWPAVMQLCIA